MKKIDMRYYICAFIGLSLIISCDVSIKKENNEADIEVAKELSNNFYNLVIQKNFEEASLYFGPSIGYEDGLDILINVNNHIGNLDSVIYINGTSKTINSAKSVNAEYVLNFNTYYNKNRAKEEMVIELINDTLKIEGYHPRVTVTSTSED